MFRRTLSLLLVLVLTAGLAMPFGATAADLPAHNSGRGHNPLYQDVPAPVHQTVQARTRKALDGVEYLTPLEAADVLRAQMVQRVSHVELFIKTSDFWMDSGEVNWVSEDFLPMVFLEELSTGPYDGDYLMWSWSEYTWDQYYNDEDCFELDLDLIYYTDYEQEQAVWNGVKTVCKQLDLDGKTPLQQYTAIYDFITQNVTYDNEGLASLSDGDDTNDDWLIYTAYSALIYGEAVCQGYATLFYAMCRYAGLPVRVVTGSVHAWNIVRIGDLWYNVDSTWDSDTISGRDYFLKNMAAFDDGGHDRDPNYVTPAFLSAHPMSQEDYDFSKPEPIDDPEDPTDQPDKPVIRPDFTDLRAGAFYVEPVFWAVENEITNGMTATNFAPDEPCTRAQIVTFLWRFWGCPESHSVNPFIDVHKKNYYYEAVLWAVDEGITLGTTTTTFSPDQPCKRSEVVTFLWRSLGNPYTSFEESPFRDVTGGFAFTPILWAVESGVTKGTGPDTFSPNESCTRGQIVTFLYRAMAA